MLVLLCSLLASAQDAVTLEAVRRVQEGDAPSLTFHAAVSGRIDAELTCAGRSATLATAITPGSSHTLRVEGLSRGVHRCAGRLALDAADGTSGEMPLSLEVEVLPALALSVAPEDLDLDARALTLTADRGLSRVAVEVLGEGGARLGTGETPAHGARQVQVSWAQEPGEVVRIDVTAWDVAELAGRLELSPWSYAIPHEDVVFASGQAVIAPDEVPKLEAAWAELEAVRARYGEVVEVRLFVAGYTDTVGSEASNQALSEARARAIAGWFAERGFSGPIAYQGFGESVPAVPTADETPEAANRRAIYLLAAQPPPPSPELPRSAWVRLR